VPTVAVIQFARFAHGELEHFLGARLYGRSGPVVWTGFPFLDRLFDFFAGCPSSSTLRFWRTVAATPSPSRMSPSKMCSGPHVFMVETRGFLASHRKGPFAPAR